MKKLIIIFLITLFLSSCLIPILKPKEAELLEVKAPLKSPPLFEQIRKKIFFKR